MGKIVTYNARARQRIRRGIERTESDRYGYDRRPIDHPTVIPIRMRKHSTRTTTGAI